MHFTASTYRDVWKDLIAREGPKGAAKGFSLNLIKGPIAFSVSLTVYDLLRAYFHGANPPVPVHYGNKGHS